MLVKVVAENPWPLPWYLRHLPNVGYWEQTPPHPDAPVVIVANLQQAEVEANLQGNYEVHHYGLRPDVVLSVHVERELWQAFVEKEERRATEPDRDRPR